MAGSRAAWLVVVASLLSAALCDSRCAWGQQFDMPPQPPPGSVIWAARAEPLPSPPSPAADSLELAPLPLDDKWRPGEAFEEGFAELPHGEDCQCLECQGPLLFPRWHGFPRVVPRMLSWWKPQGGRPAPRHRRSAGWNQLAQSPLLLRRVLRRHLRRRLHPGQYPTARRTAYRHPAGRRFTSLLRLRNAARLQPRRFVVSAQRLHQHH
jgi:hypothetical protein